METEGGVFGGKERVSEKGVFPGAAGCIASAGLSDNNKQYPIKEQSVVGENSVRQTGFLAAILRRQSPLSTIPYIGKSWRRRWFPCREMSSRKSLWKIMRPRQSLRRNFPKMRKCLLRRGFLRRERTFDGRITDNLDERKTIATDGCFLWNSLI